MSWQQLQIAPDRSHHIHPDGKPAYDVRFTEVLKFHAPGLAPAMSLEGATHIDPQGEAAYSYRFQRTFGFYEALAAVDTKEGWFHIHPDGSPAYGRRHAWCGNFQGERCAIRHADGSYGHICHNGTPAYEGTWRYAGDVRDGVAVVQRADGMHGHIEVDGAPLHERWFVDLDVFHKGFARGRDSGGWTHVHRDGTPAYGRRFAQVEPFYNGQARVELFDGALQVIDESGNTLVELRPPTRSAFAALSSDMVGFWRTEAIAAAVRLGIADELPATTPELAAVLAAHPTRLEALLRALAELRLIRRHDRTWELTSKGALLQRDHPLTLADAALEYVGPLHALWQRLPAAVQDPGWTAPDVFGDVARDPARVVSHHRMLRSYARHDYGGVAKVLGLRGDEVVLDVGGGTGTLATMLSQHHPDLTVHVLDRPEVVALLEPTDRVHPAVADLFQPLPVQGDVGVLARVLHDWDDEMAVSILRTVRDALPPNGRVFLIEMLVSADGVFGGLCDLHLLMATGGRERTAEEYRDLLELGGFHLTHVHDIAGLPSVLEAVSR